MLKLSELEKSLTSAFEEVLPTAFEEALKVLMPETTKDGSTKFKKAGETFKELVSAELGERIANAIDYYVRNITIYGNLITVGSPTTHTCTINSPSPITNGKVPNTLGIK